MPSETWPRAERINYTHIVKFKFSQIIHIFQNALNNSLTIHECTENIKAGDGEFLQISSTSWSLTDQIKCPLPHKRTPKSSVFISIPNMNKVIISVPGCHKNPKNKNSQSCQMCVHWTAPHSIHTLSLAV